MQSFVLIRQSGSHIRQKQTNIIIRDISESEDMFSRVSDSFSSPTVNFLTFPCMSIDPSNTVLTLY